MNKNIKEKNYRIRYMEFIDRQNFFVKLLFTLPILHIVYNIYRIYSGFEYCKSKTLIFGLVSFILVFTDSLIDFISILFTSNLKVLK